MEISPNFQQFSPRNGIGTGVAYISYQPHDASHTFYDGGETMNSIFEMVNALFAGVVPVADFLWDFPTNF